MPYFHFLALINNAAMKFCVHIFVWTYVFTFGERITRSKIVGITWYTLLNFWGPIAFNKLLCYFAFLLTMYNSSNFFISFRTVTAGASFFLYLFFIIAILLGVKGSLTVWIIFLWWLMMSISFSYRLLVICILFRETSVQMICLFLIGLIIIR